MKPENPNPVPAAAPAAPADPSGNGLSTPAQVEQLADQLTACADALHERIMRDIHAYGSGAVPRAAQEAARQLLDEEQVLRQRANGLYLDAATLVVHSLGQSQQHLLAVTADAAQKLKKLTKLRDALGVIGRVLELSAAAATGQPALILRALEDMKHMLDYVALHNAPPPPAGDEGAAKGA